MARAETMCGSWSASCRVHCSELNNVEGEGHGSVGERHGSVGRRYVTRGQDENTQGTGDRYWSLLSFSSVAVELLFNASGSSRALGSSLT